MCDETGRRQRTRHRRVIAAIRRVLRRPRCSAGRSPRTSNPEVLARMLLGSLHQFCMSELFARDAGGISASDFAREVVDVLLAAVSAPEPGRSARAPCRASASSRIRPMSWHRGVTWPVGHAALLVAALGRRRRPWPLSRSKTFLQRAEVAELRCREKPSATERQRDREADVALGRLIPSLVGARRVHAQTRRRSPRRYRAAPSGS